MQKKVRPPVSPVSSSSSSKPVNPSFTEKASFVSTGIDTTRRTPTSKEEYVFVYDKSGEINFVPRSWINSPEHSDAGYLEC